VPGGCSAWILWGLSLLFFLFSTWTNVLFCRRSALPPCRRSALPPCRRSALPPCRRSALPPCRPAALPPCRPAALPPCRRSALPPVCPAALPPVCPAAGLPCRRSALPPCRPEVRPPCRPAALKFGRLPCCFNFLALSSIDFNALRSRVALTSWPFQITKKGRTLANAALVFLGVSVCFCFPLPDDFHAVCRF
jgi:hypothetical protein